MRPSRFQSVSPWRMKYIGGFGSITVLRNRDVGRFGILHADDMIARIDMHDLTGDAATQFGSQFLLVLPFTIQGGQNSIASVNVQLQNGKGASATVTANF